MKRKVPFEPLLIGLLCLGPLALAVFLYYGPFDRADLPTLDNPERELIAPQVTLPAEALTRADGTLSEPDWARYRWSLIYAKMGVCDEKCLRELTRLSQVYFALGRDRDRARRVFLFAAAEPPVQGGADVLVARLDDERGARLVPLLGRRKIEAGRIFVADPLGDLVLSYPPDADQSQLLEDLKRLLDVSGIG